MNTAAAKPRTPNTSPPPGSNRNQELFSRGGAGSLQTLDAITPVLILRTIFSKTLSPSCDAYADASPTKVL